VIAYASRSLTGAEQNYNTTEKELLAIIWAIDRFRPYLYGVEFDLITDHKPLTYMTDLNLGSARITRWKMRLQEYNFNIIHKAGKDHTNADTLSRIVESLCPIESSGGVLDELKMQTLQQADKTLSQIRTRLEKGEIAAGYRLVNGILFIKQKEGKEYGPSNDFRLVVPEAMIGDVLQTCHDDISGAHLGVNKTWHKVSNKFYWPTMMQDIEEWIGSCPICAARKNPQSSKGPLGSITHPEKPFDTIGIDFLGPLTETNEGNRYVLVITDYATRWVEAFPTRDTKASTVAKILINEIISRHSAPKEILSDRGQSFLNKTIEEISSYFKIKKLSTTAYNPKCNGLTERFNASLCRMLSAYCDAMQADWDVYLPVALLAHRTSWQRTVKESPFRLLYGRNPRLPSDVDQWCPSGQFTKELDYVWKLSRKEIQKEAGKTSIRTGEKYKKQVRWTEGDQVRLNNPVTKVGLKDKLRGNRWLGPYVVSKAFEHNVELDITGKHKIINNSRVKPAEKPRSSRFGRIYKTVDRLGVERKRPLTQGRRGR